MSAWKSAFGEGIRVMELPGTEHIKEATTRTVNSWRGYAVLAQPRLGSATATFFLTLAEAQAFESAARAAFPVAETQCRQAVWSQVFDGKRDVVTVVTGREVRAQEAADLCIRCYAPGYDGFCPACSKFYLGETA